MKESKTIIFGFGILAIGLIIAAFVLPWGRINWGRVSWSQAETVTVSGFAKSQERNQIASFNAGVMAVADDKEEAVNEVNEKVAAIIEAVKDFGIKEEDVQTQSISIYQEEERYKEGGVEKSRKGQWRVQNSVEVTLREIDKASALADLLTSSGANQVYGPNFRMDDTTATEKKLTEEAIKDAKERAEVMATAAGRRLGKVISVNEGGGGSSYLPLMRDTAGMGGAGAPVEPGSSTVSKSVTVVFELK